MALRHCTVPGCTCLIRSDRAFCHEHWMALPCQTRDNLNDLQATYGADDVYERAVASAAAYLADPPRHLVVS